MGTSMDERAGLGDRPVEEMSYTEASAELDAIVGFFEGREVDIDLLVGRLVRATAIIEELDARLRRTQMQVEQLVPRLTAVLGELADDQREAGDPTYDEPPDPDAPAGADEVAAQGPAREHVDDGDDETPGLF
ncbi:MAG TPA: hypothetical protein VND62_07625 [Acidimicrobiales bacterium]|nr:hypothetical protein [Acidimicrobiales bacterium]